MEQHFEGMSKADTNQASEDELDKLCPICKGTTWQMNSDYEEVPCWHDIHDRDIKQALLDWHNKQVEEVLDRLEARLTEEASGIRQIKTDYAYGFTAANDQTNEAIEAERNKLKESSNGI